MQTQGVTRRTQLDPTERVEGQLVFDYPDFDPEADLEALSNQQLADRIVGTVLAKPCLRHHKVMASCEDCLARLRRVAER